MELLTAAQMRAIEQAAIDSGEVTGLELMERAGRGVVEAIFEWRPELAASPGRAVVLCGPGNNGGDGFVVARRLKDKGWTIALFLYGDRAKLPPNAMECAALWESVGDTQLWSVDAIQAVSGPDLIIDAVFGIGLNRVIPEDVGRGFKAAKKRADGQKRWFRPRVIAIDCPTGLSSDSGELLKPPFPDYQAMPEDKGAEAVSAWSDRVDLSYIRADLTVTFHDRKIGHFLASGPYACGTVSVKGIGLRTNSQWASVDVWPDARCVRLVDPSLDSVDNTAKRWARRIVETSRHSRHKYQRGHVVVLAGGSGKGGAARLAARSGLRVGAGLATILCPQDALAENAAQLNSIMLRPLQDVDQFTKILEDKRITSVCIGPGLGVGEKTRALVAAAVEMPRKDQERFETRRVVIDADAITSFAEDPNELFELTHLDCVLTPHEGEFARLFPDLSMKARLGSGDSKLAAAQKASARAGCMVILKGEDTVIASPNGTTSLHSAAYDRTAHWLGTGGAGDVLAGMIAGLFASTRLPDHYHWAAEFAVWLHVEAAREFGPGLIAEDLPETLPKVFRNLGL